MGTKPEIDLTTPYVIVVATVEITDAAPKRVLKALGGEPWLKSMPIAVPCPDDQGWDWIPTKAQIEQVGNNIIEQFLIEARVFPDFARTAEGPVEWYDLEHIEEQAVANPKDFDEFTFEYSIELENEEGDKMENDSPEDAYWATLVPVMEGHAACIFVTGRVTRLPQMLVISTEPPNYDSV